MSARPHHTTQPVALRGGGARLCPGPDRGSSAAPRSRSCFACLVKYVGIDLAWAERNRTGVAVLNDAGKLVSCRSVVTDEKLAAGLPSGSGLVVAIDAPLIVRNQTGQRRCEKRVGQLYGYANASAHTSNLSRAQFRPEPRGARLAHRFGWDLDPHVRPDNGRSVCIEVYPHPAMVVLFGLDNVIQYKAKSGRDLDFLRAQHAILLGHMERTCGPLLRLDESEDWHRLRDGVESATRKVDLRVVEDQVDAVLCAFLAWMWANARDEMQVLPEDHHGIGDADLDQGYIVTPRVR